MQMKQRTISTAIAAMLAIAAAIGGWTVVIGTDSKAAVSGQSSYEVKRPTTPSEPSLVTLW
jgi:hypothetical protein